MNFIKGNVESIKIKGYKFYNHVVNLDFVLTIQQESDGMTYRISFVMDNSIIVSWYYISEKERDAMYDLILQIINTRVLKP